MTKILISPKKGAQGIGAGVWNIGPGRDPFGGPTRAEIPILDRIPLLAGAGITYLEPVKDLALCVVLQDAGWEGILAFDVKAPRTDIEADLTDILTTSAANLQRLWTKAAEVDRGKVRRFRETQRYTALAGYLTACLY